MRLLLLISSSVLLGAAAPTPVIQTVSLSTIFERPAEFDGHRVRVHGFFYVNYGASMWASEADFRNQRYERAAFIEDPRFAQHQDHPLSGRWAYLTGDITSVRENGRSGVGPYDLYGIEITQVEEIVTDPMDTDRARPWHNDPILLILGSLGLLALFYGVMTWATRAFRNAGKVA